VPASTVPASLSPASKYTRAFSGRQMVLQLPQLVTVLSARSQPFARSPSQSSNPARHAV
jgi:hypothetical protein